MAKNKNEPDIRGAGNLAIDAITGITDLVEANWIDIILEISPYSAPFSRLAKIRSAGVTGRWTPMTGQPDVLDRL